jgi:hypothetical protein
VDACLLSGFEHLGTFPPLIDTSAYSFRTAYEMVRAFKTGYSASTLLLPIRALYTCRRGRAWFWIVDVAIALRVQLCCKD